MELEKLTSLTVVTVPAVVYVGDNVGSTVGALLGDSLGSGVGTPSM